MDFIFEKKNDLKPEFCQSIIELFEKDPAKQPGRTGGGLHTSIKFSTDLMLTRFPHWEHVVKALDLKLKDNLVEYIKFLATRSPIVPDNLQNAWHCGYQIQRSGYYKWHHDSMIEHGRVRMLTFIWYLNDIEEGGHTGFTYKTVKPECGKFVMFPATWDYIHCGFETNNKYIITGWLHLEL